MNVHSFPAVNKNKLFNFIYAKIIENTGITVAIYSYSMRPKKIITI